MSTRKIALSIGALLLSQPIMAIEIAKTKTTSLEFGGWIAAEYSRNSDNSPYDLGFNSNASRLFFAGEHAINNDIIAYGKLEYALAFSDVNDTEFNTRLGYIGIHTQYGSIEAGKVWSPFYDVAMYSDTAFSHKDAASGAFFAPASEIGGFGRADNSVKYRNSFSLVNGKIIVGAIVGDQSDINVTDAVTVSTTYGASLQYAKGGFQLGIAHQSANVDGLANNENAISATIVGAFYNHKDFMVGGNYTIGTNNQKDFGASNIASELVDSKGIEGFAHYRWSESWKAYAGYNHLTTDRDNYTTEFANIGIVKNFDKQLALYSEYRIDLDSTDNSLFVGDAWTFGIIYFFSQYPQYF